jgi:adenine-specific DNA-methyltransferase
LRDLMEGKIFDNPKDHEELARFIEYVTSKNDLVMDFFAGSGSTAEAILDLNRRDGGARKFILAPLPEPTPEKSAAREAGYDNIADIGKERIRRVIRKLNDEDDGKLISEDDRPQDRGFKVFMLTSSNFKTWDGTVIGSSDENALLVEEQLLNAVENVNESRSSEDMLYEVLLRAGWPLTTEVEVLEAVDGEIYAAESENGTMFVCLEDPVTEELLGEMIGREPAQLICLDTAFHGNDQLKTNTVLEMRDRGIEFRTI